MTGRPNFKASAPLSKNAAPIRKRECGSVWRTSKAYAHYRDAQCAFAASLGGGAIGNALELRRLSCLVGLNNGRAKQINTDSSELPPK